jgi:para-aminobenzoate N-oxygenase AurF
MYRELALDELLAIGNSDRSVAVAARAAAEYDSRFGNWDIRASVRRRPRRLLGRPPSSVLYFPPALVPVAGHPLVAGLGQAAVRRLLVQRLYQYLHFTTELEELAVMPVVAKISRGRVGLELPVAMREDAFKIATDEAWHAQFSYDLMRQVVDETGVVCRLPELPQFVERLDAIRNRLDPDVRGTESLLFAIVSETLISSILADIPRDDRLPTAVRQLVGDHAEDEGRHHAYFRTFLNYFWHALDDSQRRALGPWIPATILSFLEPDYRAIGYALRETGLAQSDVEHVVAESFPRQRVARDAVRAARWTVRYLAEAGVLDDERTRDAFVESGLWEEG